MTTANTPAKQQSKEERQETFIHLLLNNHERKPVKQLAIQAGYSPKYADTNLYAVIASDSFKNKVLKYARASEIVQIPKLLSITQKALDEYDKDARLAIEKPALLRQIRQDVELSKSDERVASPVINIQTMNVVRSGLRGYFEQDVIEGHLVDE